MQPSPYLDAAIEAARAAADVIRHYYRRQLEVTVKADNSPVTQADIEAEQTIRRLLEARFPAHGFFGEETGRDRADAEYLWLVDPIDGTKSFVRRYPFFSTQIALMHEGRIIVGVSSAPAFDELAWAEAGRGAFLDDEPVRVSDVDTIADATISSGNLATLARGPRWKKWGSVVADVNRIRGYGDFYHYHLLASGRIDAVVESDVNILDIAALSLLVEQAGGRFTDLDGAPIDLHTTSVLATNGLLHEPLRARL
jgi:histidinol-phosphatase